MNIKGHPVQSQFISQVTGFDNKDDVEEQCCPGLGCPSIGQNRRGRLEAGRFEGSQ